MTRLYIVRHGNTFEPGEPPRRIGSRTDLPLTSTGVAQAEALGRWFRDSGVRFGRTLSSNLRRTLATAEAILAQQPDPPHLERADFLAEIDHGPDEGKPEAEVLARLGRAALELWDTQLIPPSGWDALSEWRMSAWRNFAAETRHEGMDQTILLVTSNGAARFALAALGLNPGENAGGVKLRTGAYGLIEIDGGGACRLVEWDRRPA